MQQDQQKILFLGRELQSMFASKGQVTGGSEGASVKEKGLQNVEGAQ